ncbi:MAG TPA: DUF4194 domain-containing protein [Desulfitobacteriaceae bacterium]|nr:DUF4194 domain-containing protein [Desulfitobacteriaceae bacterium]
MGLSDLSGFTDKEREMFTSVCNHLLGQTFLLRTIYQPDGSAINNPEYNFLVLHSETVKSYLSLLGWELHQDIYNGYFYVLNSLDANRLTLGSKPTAILLALRLIYDENSERVGLFQDVLCEVREVLEKLITDFGVFRQKPNMDEFRRAMKVLEDHNIIKGLEGKYSDADCRFTILPTILTVVSVEKLNALVANLRKEDESDEGADEDAAH